MTAGHTIVLVHGAGHTAAVWDRTRAELRHRSVVVDLPGRASRPGDLTAVGVDEAAAAAEALASILDRIADGGRVRSSGP